MRNPPKGSGSRNCQEEVLSIRNKPPFQPLSGRQPSDGPKVPCASNGQIHSFAEDQPAGVASDFDCTHQLVALLPSVLKQKFLVRRRIDPQQLIVNTTVCFRLLSSRTDPEV